MCSRIALATALTVIIPTIALADGTQAGTNVQNTFTLDYRVSGVDQNTIDSTATPTEFTVDRLIDLTVATNGDTGVPPGAQNQDLVFSLTNEGNDVQAYALSVVNEGGDEFSAASTTLYYYIDDGDAVFEPGALADDGNAIAYNSTKTPDLAADAMFWVIVRGNIPAGLDDTDTDDISVVANTLEPSSGGASATPVVADTDGNSLTGAAENVLADGSGTSNEAANEGDHSASSAFVVASADVEAVKALTIFSEDGVGCATIPGTAAVGEQYSIPGACIEYVITVQNTGGTSATDLIINDILEDELEFVAAAVTGFTGGSFATPALPSANTDCTGGACEINFTGGTLAAGSTGTPTVATVTIRALIQ
jgi:uncharacterized repeat protein (TIGR01451 family)